MELILLFGGVVFMVALVAFIWGKFDPEIKAQNDKYEKSLKDNDRDKSDRPTKKEVTEQNKIKDNMAVSLDSFEEMPNMEISNDLLKDALIQYKKYSELSFVVKPSLPILYFGDINAYFNSNFKVVTAALNPSDAEFKEFRNSDISNVRFPEYNNTIETLYLSLNNYFKKNPYKKWFGTPNVSKGGFLPLLNGLKTCYYEGSKENTAIHTDICSPLATTPTWSGLSPEQKKILFSEGFKLWKKLILEIKPDLILMSLKKSHLELLPLDFVKRIETIKGKSSPNRKQLEYVIDHFRLNLDGFNTNVIWGSAQNTPLQPFRNKRELGTQIFKYLENYKEPGQSKKENEITNNIIKIPEVLEGNDLTIKRTRFYVNEIIYQQLVDNRSLTLNIEIEPNRGRHSKGKYKIPNQNALDFIDTKRNTYNWDNNMCFHQDGIPRALRSYFTIDKD